MSNSLLKNTRRGKTDAIAHARALDVDAADIDDLRSALRELQVYQQELEAQHAEMQTTQLAQRETTQLYRDFYHSAPAGYLTLNDQGIITELNASAARLLGSQRQNLLGLPLAQCLSLESRADLPRYIDSVLSQPGLHQCELTFPQADGTQVVVSAESCAIDSPIPGMWRMVLLDITSKKAADDERRRRMIELRALLDSQTSYFIRTDLDGNLTYWNRKFEELYAWIFDDGKIHGGRALETILPHHHQRTQETVERCILEPGKVVQVELDKVDREGGIRPTLWEFCCLTDANGVPEMIQCIGFDISRRRRLESAYAASERRYRQMFESHGLPKLIVAPDSGTIIDANPAAARFYGIEIGQLKELTIFDVNQGPRQEIMAKMAEAVAGDAQTCQFVHRAAGNVLRDVEVFTGVFEVDDEVLLYLIVTDVTEGERAKIALHEANASLEQRVQERTSELEHAKNRIEAILNHSSDGIVLLDAAKGILEANDTFGELIGCGSMSYLGRRLASFGNRATDASIADLVQSVLETGSTRSVEAIIHRQDESQIDVEISASPVKGERGQLVCTLRDITAHKAAERKLAEERNLLRTVIDTVPDYIVVKDLGHRILMHNVAHARSLGASSTMEFVGRDTAEDPRPAEQLEKFLADDRRVMNEGKALINEVERTQGAEGTPIWVSTTKVPLRNLAEEIIGLVGISRDISDLKAAEEALLASEERYRATVEAMAEGIVMQGNDGAIRLCNSAAEEILGLSRDQLMGRTSIDPTWRSVKEDGTPFPGEEHPAMVTLRSGEPQRGVIMGVHKPSGELTWISINSSPLFLLGATQPDAVVATFTDITDQVLAQESLVQNQKRLSLATAAAEIGIWDLDRTTGRMLWDERMLALYGLTPETFTGHAADWKKYVHPDDYPMVREGREAALRGERPYEFEFRIIHPTRGVRYIKTQGTVLRNKAGEPERVIGVNVDITEIKKAELTLRSALAKEQELGELKSRFVSMASHEFRTPLAGILATAESLSIYRDKMTPAQMDMRIQRIRDRVKFMSDVIEDLLVLARMQAGRADYHPDWVDMEVLCRDVISETTVGVNTGIHIDFQSEIRTPQAYADARMLSQVLQNLLANAIKYSTPSQPISMRLSQDDQEFIISVQDHGIGIPHADLAYLFEPFHRATNVGQIPGTGLGLSIAMRAIEEHCGTIDVESEVGVGTTFTVRFPLPSEPTAE